MFTFIYGPYKFGLLQENCTLQHNKNVVTEILVASWMILVLICWLVLNFYYSCEQLAVVRRADVTGGPCEPNTLWLPLNYEDCLIYKD